MHVFSKKISVEQGYLLHDFHYMAHNDIVMAIGAEVANDEQFSMSKLCWGLPYPSASAAATFGSTGKPVLNGCGMRAGLPVVRSVQT
jgi:hypothetical protein